MDASMKAKLEAIKELIEQMTDLEAEPYMPKEEAPAEAPPAPAEEDMPEDEKAELLRKLSEME